MCYSFSSRGIAPSTRRSLTVGIVDGENAMVSNSLDGRSM